MKVRSLCESMNLNSSGHLGSPIWGTNIHVNENPKSVRVKAQVPIIDSPGSAKLKQYTLEDQHGTYKSLISKGKWSSKPTWLCSMLIFRGVVGKGFTFADHQVHLEGSSPPISRVSNETPECKRHQQQHGHCTTQLLHRTGVVQLWSDTSPQDIVIEYQWWPR